MYARNVLATLSIAMVAAPSALAAPQSVPPHLELGCTEARGLFVRDYDASTHALTGPFAPVEARAAVDNLLKRQQDEKMLAHTVLPAIAFSLVTLVGAVLF
ncbi:hypothetical protein EUX98_g4030 [Antrodiella citrinella]|uniref:Uncharacterized protein n=1 Tax=Antrodiella citrinella TaxID=2447956 RepID=A0A4S4MX27_9APHY|nr:hypothetical protein EUX98_g4030 [Antrodiella citrinella]